MKRFTGSPDGPEAAQRAYAREELVAELGAVLLGDRLEIGSEVSHHAAYLSHWVTMLRESPRLLQEVLGEARRAADRIVAEPAVEPAPKNSEAA
jgi:antirestriction protein ArdC